MTKLKPMMGTIVDRLQEMRAELDTVDELLRERERIDAALAAAGNGAPAPPARRPPVQRRRPGSKPGAPRAPRGQNREKILAIAANKPMSVEEIAQATGIRRPVVTTSVSTYTKRGEMRRVSRGRYRTVAPAGSARRRTRTTARGTRRPRR